MPGSTQRSSRTRASVWLLVAVLAGGAVRAGVTAAVYPTKLTGDEYYYLETAANLATGRGHYSASRNAWAGWPPAYPFLLSQVPGAERSLAPVMVFQGLLSTLLVACVGLLGWSLFGPAAGAVAAWIAALYPTFIAYGHYLWSETLFLLLASGGMACAVRTAHAARLARWVWAAGAGLLFGLAGLTRELGLVFAGCAALAWLWTGLPVAHDERRADDERRLARRTAAGPALLVLVLALAVVAPWTARNHARFGRLVPVSTVGWMGVREGNTFAAHDWLRPHLPTLSAFRSRYFAERDEMARMDLARREALERIAAEQPSWLWKKAVRTSALLFGPDSFLFKKLSRGAYGALEPGIVRPVVAATVGSYLGVMALGLLGALLARAPGQRLPLGLAGAAVVGLHLVAHASSRYRLPLMPLLMVYAGFATTRLAAEGPGALGRIPRRQLAVAGAAAVVVLGWGLVYFAPDAVALWQRGTYVEPFRP